MKQLKYLGYCRKSSEAERKQYQSLGTQKRIIRECASRENLQVIDILLESKSAKTDGERPVFRELMRRIRNGEANCLLVAHIDRLSRNMVEAGELDKLINNDTILEIKTPYRVFKKGDDFSLGLELLQAADFSKRLSMRVHEGNLSKVLRGEFPNQAPLGYFNKDGKIYPDPVRAPLVKLMFEFYASGEYSLSQITDVMYEKGLRSRQAGNKIYKSNLHRHLTNPLFYGAIPYKDKLYPGTHTPIVSKSLFDAVQQVMYGNKVTNRKHVLNFLYRGYMTCDVCGCKLTATLKKGRYVYYYCTNGKKNCEQGKEYLNESEVKDLFQATFTDFALPADLAEASLQVYQDRVKNDSHFSESVWVGISKELESSEKRLSNLEDMLMNGRITEERYDHKRNKILNQQTDLELQLKHQKPADPESTLELLDKVKHKAVNVAEMFADGDDEVRGDLLKGLLWNSTIRDKEIVSTRYKKPFSYLEGLSKVTDFEGWLARCPVGGTPFMLVYLKTT